MDRSRALPALVAAAITVATGAGVASVAGGGSGPLSTSLAPAKKAAGKPGTALPTTSAKLLLAGFVTPESAGAEGGPAVRARVMEVRWSELQPRPDAVDSSSIDAELARARSAGQQVKLRVLGGVHAPQWVKKAAGSVNLDLGGAAAGKVDVAQWWSPEYLRAWDQLHATLADRYDREPALGPVALCGASITGCSPYWRAAESGGNRKALLAAGFSVEGDASALAANVDLGRYWSLTPVEVTFAPYQALTRKGVREDVASAIEHVRSFRERYGSRAVLGAEEVGPGGLASSPEDPLLAEQQRLGPPISYRLAAVEGPEERRAALELAAGLGATSIELPDPGSWPATELAPYAERLAANAGASGRQTPPTTASAPPPPAPPTPASSQPEIPVPPVPPASPASPQEGTGGGTPARPAPPATTGQRPDRHAPTKERAPESAGRRAPTEKPADPPAPAKRPGTPTSEKPAGTPAAEARKVTRTPSVDAPVLPPLPAAPVLPRADPLRVESPPVGQASGGRPATPPRAAEPPRSQSQPRDDRARRSVEADRPPVDDTRRAEDADDADGTATLPRLPEAPVLPRSAPLPPQSTVTERPREPGRPDGEDTSEEGAARPGLLPSPAGRPPTVGRAGESPSSGRSPAGVPAGTPRRTPDTSTPVPSSAAEGTGEQAGLPPSPAGGPRTPAGEGAAPTPSSPTPPAGQSPGTLQAFPRTQPAGARSQQTPGSGVPLPAASAAAPSTPTLAPSTPTSAPTAPSGVPSELESGTPPRRGSATPSGIPSTPRDRRGLTALPQAPASSGTPARSGQQEDGVLWNGNWETGAAPSGAGKGDGGSQYARIEEEGGGGIVSTVESPTRSTDSSRVGRFHMPAGTQRSQAVAKHFWRPDDEGSVERWFGVSLFFGDDWDLAKADSGSDWCSLVSFRTTGDNGSMNVSCEDGGHLALRRNTKTSWPDGLGLDKIDLGPIQKGRWTDLVFHIRFSTTEQGALREVWRDGQLMGRKTSANSVDGNEHRFRVGVYQSPSVNDDRTLYVDNAKIGTSYQAVNPGKGGAGSTGPTGSTAAPSVPGVLPSAPTAAAASASTPRRSALAVSPSTRPAAAPPPPPAASPPPPTTPSTTPTRPTDAVPSAATAAGTRTGTVPTRASSTLAALPTARTPLPSPSTASTSSSGTASPTSRPSSSTAGVAPRLPAAPTVSVVAIDRSSPGDTPSARSTWPWSPSAQPTRVVQGRATPLPSTPLPSTPLPSTPLPSTTTPAGTSATPRSTSVSSRPGSGSRSTSETPASGTSEPDSRDE